MGGEKQVREPVPAVPPMPDGHVSHGRRRMRSHRAVAGERTESDSDSATPKIYAGPDDPPYERPTDDASERRLIDLLFERLAAFHQERERLGLAEILRGHERKELRRP